jgi:hypothetical protein
MWERACPRRRRWIQHGYKLTYRFREQACSHFFARNWMKQVFGAIFRAFSLS